MNKFCTVVNFFIWIIIKKLLMIVIEKCEKSEKNKEISA